MCGKTIRSLKRNVVTPMVAMLKEIGFSCTEKLSQNLLEIEFDGKSNRFYLFGGKDESSAALIQGMTLCGVLFDEVALMPKSFVEQAIARCSVNGSKFWFNCTRNIHSIGLGWSGYWAENEKTHCICTLQWTTTHLFPKR